MAYVKGYVPSPYQDQPVLPSPCSGLSENVSVLVLATALFLMSRVHSKYPDE
jgi:hypothetical protein